MLSHSELIENRQFQISRRQSPFSYRHNGLVAVDVLGVPWLNRKSHRPHRIARDSEIDLRDRRWVCRAVVGRLERNPELNGTPLSRA